MQQVWTVFVAEQLTVQQRCVKCQRRQFGRKGCTVAILQSCWTSTVLLLLLIFRISLFNTQCSWIQLSQQTTPKGFEPLRAEPNGFLVHHLSHSVTVSMFQMRIGVEQDRYASLMKINIKPSSTAFSGPQVFTQSFGSHMQALAQYTYIHTYIHTCINTYIHAHTYIHTYIHT